MISVVMPVYNTEKYVETAINCILNQTYKNFEFIIVDDFSNDNSWSIIQKFSDDDVRIKPFRNSEHQGISKTLNFGLAKASGKFIARMDSDDSCDKTRFEKQILILEDSQADVCGSYQIYMDYAGHVLFKRKYNVGQLNKIILLESPISHASVLMRRSVFEEFGYYNEGYEGSEDYELWIRLWKNNCRFVMAEEYLYRCRLHETSTKNRLAKRTIISILKIKYKELVIARVSLGLKGWLRVGLQLTLLLIPSTLILNLFVRTMKQRTND